MPTVTRVTLHQLKVPLTVPYELSIATIQAFDTLLVEVHDDEGHVGLGEGTVLTGYTHETIEQSWHKACELAARITGEPGEEARGMVSGVQATMPFTATALTTAIEMLTGTPYLVADDTPAAMPLLALVHGHEAGELEGEINQYLEQGFRTFKVKVGFDVEADLARLRRIQRILAGRGRIRVNANQGYRKDEACRFASALEPNGIELLEQTCAAGDWDAAKAVAVVATVPMMLDESIYSLDDIDRAAELKAASYIKLKLMKLGSLQGLADAIEHIRACGMEPVLGNGVACDVGCWMEACVARKLIRNAGEMNGFLKTEGSLLVEPLAVEDGTVTLRPGFVPRLDPAALKRYAQATVSFP
jgi:L-alanine-DL-glutamate epimerase-like enolase superfamily enzyme